MNSCLASSVMLSSSSPSRSSVIIPKYSASSASSRRCPTTLRRSWKIDAAIGTEKLKGSFKSGQEAEVKVPAGTYKDVVTVTGEDIDANGRKISMTYYFAKEVGIIKQRIKFGDAAETVTFELEKFEAGKAEPGK